MSPKQADPNVRAALVETAAQLLADGGPEHLTLRRLTAAVGTSTMSVYTHFGSMDELRAEVAREGFDRLRRHLQTVTRTRDPVADLIRLGLAYTANANENPHLYRAIFSEPPVGGEGEGVGFDTFLMLVAAVERCIGAGRFAPAEPVDLATQLWAALHGAITLGLSGLLDADQSLQALRAMARNLFVGFGDDPDRVERSFRAADRTAAGDDVVGPDRAG